jgi:hypothetical protein
VGHFRVDLLRISYIARNINMNTQNLSEMLGLPDGKIVKIKTKRSDGFIYGRLVTADGTPQVLGHGTFRKVDDFEKFTEDETAATCSEITIDASEIESAEIVNVSRQKSDYIRGYIVK